LAKARVQFVCQSCGTVHARWAGKCDGCGEWNTIVEDDPTGGVGGGPGTAARKGRAVALASLSGEIEEAPRISTLVSELDRVTGGGFVRGSAVLVGGDPGIGKSTLLMQAAAALARQGNRVIYVSGEEAVAQVRLRAQRLGAADSGVLLAAETNVEDILATLAEGKRPDFVIIDSIQTLWSDTADSAPGTVTQVRTGVQAMIMEAGLDTGPVLATETTPITASDTTGSVHDRLSALAADLAVTALAGLVDGALIPQAQPCEGVTYAHKVTAEDQRIDWSRPAAEVDCQIRGLSPFPSAWFLYTPEGETEPLRMKALMSRLEAGRAEAAPGALLDDTLLVQCGDGGAVRLHALQKPGSRAMEADDFLRGNKVAKGTRFE